MGYSRYGWKRIVSIYTSKQNDFVQRRFLVLQMSDWSYGGADFNGNIIPVEAKSKVKFINKVYSYKNKHDLAPAYNAALEKLDNATKIWEQQVASAMNHRNSFSFLLKTT